MSIANRCPTLTRLRCRTSYPLGLPIDGELAMVKARSRFGLPTQIRHHRTEDIHLIAAVTQSLHIRIDIAHIHQMLLRKHLLLGQLFMQFPHDLPVWRRSGGGDDVDNQMRCVGLTRLG